MCDICDSVGYNYRVLQKFASLVIMFLKHLNYFHSPKKSTLKEKSSGKIVEKPHFAQGSVHLRGSSFKFRRRNENQNTDNRKIYGKIQIVTGRFRMRLHASNVGIQFLSHNIKVFNFKINLIKLYR